MPISDLTADQRAFVLSFIWAGQDEDTPQTGGVSLVELGRARLGWVAARAALEAGIERLIKAIETDYADMKEAQTQVRAAAAQLRRMTGALNVALEDDLDAVLNATAGEREGPAAKAVASARQMQDFLDGEPLMSMLDDNEFTPGLQVAGPLLDQIDAVVQALRPAT